MKQNWPDAYRWILQAEGGLTNNRHDRGGLTNHGITNGEYQRYQREHGIRHPRSVTQITMPEVEEIYREKYWNAIGGDNLPGPLDKVLFDVAVNNGLGRVQPWLRHGLGLPADATTAQVNAAIQHYQQKGTIAEVAKSVVGFRDQFYNEIISKNPSLKTFAKGWHNRDQNLLRSINNGIVPSKQAPLPKSSIKSPKAGTEDTPASIGSPQQEYAPIPQGNGRWSMMRRGTFRYLPDQRGNRLYFSSPEEGYRAAGARLAALDAGRPGSSATQPAAIQPANAGYDQASTRSPLATPVMPQASAATYPPPVVPGAPPQPGFRPAQQASVPLGYVPAMLTKTPGLEGLYGITPAQRQQLLSQFYGKKQNVG